MCYISLTLVKLLEVVFILVFGRVLLQHHQCVTSKKQLYSIVKCGLNNAEKENQNEKCHRKMNTDQTKQKTQRYATLL